LTKARPFKVEVPLFPLSKAAFESGKKNFEIEKKSQL
jgi:hypothetical protein